MPVPRHALVLSLAALLMLSRTAAADSCAVQTLALQIDPGNRKILYAGTFGDGLLKSADGGRTWTPLIDPPVESASALLFDPTAPSSIYVATYGEYVFRSTDNGGSWQRGSRGLVPPPPPPTNSPGASNVDIFALAADPGQSSTIYAVAGAVFRSNDSGANWFRVPFAPVDQQWSAWAMLIEPEPVSKLYVAATTETQYGIFKSADHGATWSPTQSAPPIQTSSFLADPLDPNVLLAGTTQGIYRSTDAGEHWTLTKSDVPNQLLYALDVRQIVADRQNLGTLYAAATYLGILKSKDHGETWSSLRTGLGYEVVSSIAIDPVDSQLIYAGTWTGMYRSADGGATWQRSFDLGTTPVILGTEPAGGYALADGGTGSFFTIIGKGFDAQSVVSWSGSLLATSLSGCTRLFIQVPSEDLATPGTASLTVINPDGSRSDPFSFVIEPVLPSRVPVLAYGPERSRRGPSVLPPRP